MHTAIKFYPENCKHLVEEGGVAENVPSNEMTELLEVVALTVVVRDSDQDLEKYMNSS